MLKKTRKRDKTNYQKQAYCAFHKHTNSKVQKPPSNVVFFAAVNHNYDHKQRKKAKSAVKTRKAGYYKDKNDLRQVKAFWSRFT